MKSGRDGREAVGRPRRVGRWGLPDSEKWRRPDDANFSAEQTSPSISWRLLFQTADPVNDSLAAAAEGGAGEARFIDRGGSLEAPRRQEIDGEACSAAAEAPVRDVAARADGRRVGVGR
jgi:hypothetical protein